MIRGWFEDHAPQELARFRGPAAEEDLKAIERAMGRPLPGDLVAWWRLTDGTGESAAIWLIPSVWTPLATRDALSRYQGMLNFVAEEPELSQLMAEPAGSACSWVWLPHWLPIAHDLGGNYLFLDLRSGPRSGCVGVHFKDEWRYDGPRWHNVAAMLSEIADALVHHNKVGNQRAVVEDGRLHWATP